MFIRFVLRGLMALGVVGMSALPALAADGLDTGNTAWILSATALVLFMTLPGLALFYAGLVQSKNIISVLMHHFAIACLMQVYFRTIEGQQPDPEWDARLEQMSAKFRELKARALDGARGQADGAGDPRPA